jgi:hypothetical protein
MHNSVSSTVCLITYKFILFSCQKFYLPQPILDYLLIAIGLLIYINIAIFKIKPVET